MNVRGKRVFVGLSGGVDSAVTAALLKNAGAAVTGVFIKGWYPPGMPCTWAEDRRDAMRVAARLQIPFHTLDASHEYKQGVIDYLLREYKAGRTPNPDIMCNREVKFGAFYTFARTHGADFIATGHYAQKIDGLLLRGVDASKDQSYFLWAISSDALAHSLFPLGALKKEKTRELARTFNLPNAAKRDSQGICFLGSISVEDFLLSEFGTDAGEARTVEGVVVGTHNGVLLHTLGERIALTNAPPGPWYVVSKDIPTNTLTVAKERTNSVHLSSIALEHAHWFMSVSDHEPVVMQYRYRGPLVKGVLDQQNNLFTLSESLPEPLAQGQSLVVYQKDTVVGGAIIS